MQSVSIIFMICQKESLVIEAHIRMLRFICFRDASNIVVTK